MKTCHISQHVFVWKCLTHCPPWCSLARSSCTHSHLIKQNTHGELFFSIYIIHLLTIFCLCWVLSRPLCTGRRWASLCRFLASCSFHLLFLILVLQANQVLALKIYVHFVKTKGLCGRTSQLLLFVTWIADVSTWEHIGKIGRGTKSQKERITHKQYRGNSVRDRVVQSNG